MTSQVVKIDVRELRRVLRMAGEVLDISSLLEIIGERCVAWITDNFESEGANLPEGEWARNADSTIMKKGSSKPLHDTGRLKQSFDYEVGARSVRVGTNVEYAIYHEEGVDPYTIEAAPGGVLAFMGADGSTVVVRSVNHPGIPRRRMLPNQKEAEILATGLINARLEMIER